MEKLESSYYKYHPYKVACSKCLRLYIKPSDDPFVCLECLIG